VLQDRDKCQQRSRVEQLFNKLKNWRRVAARYNKNRESYLGFVSLASALLWLPFVREA
jgi:transposase